LGSGRNGTKIEIQRENSLISRYDNVESGQAPIPEMRAVSRNLVTKLDSLQGWRKAIINQASTVGAFPIANLFGTAEVADLAVIANCVQQAKIARNIEELFEN